MKRRQFGRAGCAFCYGLWVSRVRAAPTDASQMAAPGAPSSEEAAWASQWRELRPLRGHFDGAPWNPEVDLWQGRKHRLMLQLASSLVSRRAGADEVRRMLGEPDSLLRARDPAFAHVVRDVRNSDGPAADPGTSAQTALWMFRWRGQHDQLVLRLHRGITVAAGWLHALE